MSEQVCIRSEKTRYPTEGAARVAAARFRAHRDDRPGKVVAYWCPACGGWHIGHERKADHRRRRALRGEAPWPRGAVPWPRREG